MKDLPIVIYCYFLMKTNGLRKTNGKCYLYYHQHIIGIYILYEYKFAI